MNEQHKRYDGESVVFAWEALAQALRQEPNTPTSTHEVAAMVEAMAAEARRRGEGDPTW